MNDSLCDHCHQPRLLTLTYPSYEMLCFYCMDKKEEVPLMEVVEEAQNLKRQGEAMQKIWDEIDKLEKKK